MNGRHNIFTPRTNPKGPAFPLCCPNVVYVLSEHLLPNWSVTQTSGYNLLLLYFKYVVSTMSFVISW